MCSQCCESIGDIVHSETYTNTANVEENGFWGLLRCHYLLSLHINDRRQIEELGYWPAQWEEKHLTVIGRREDDVMTLDGSVDSRGKSLSRLGFWRQALVFETKSRIAEEKYSYSTVKMQINQVSCQAADIIVKEFPLTFTSSPPTKFA